MRSGSQDQAHQAHIINELRLVFLRPHEDLSPVYRVSEFVDPRFSSNSQKCYDRSYSRCVYFLARGGAGGPTDRDHTLICVCARTSTVPRVRHPGCDAIVDHIACDNHGASDEKVMALPLQTPAKHALTYVLHQL